MSTSKKKSVIVLAFTVTAVVIAIVAMLIVKNTHMSKKDKLLNLSDREVLEFLRDSGVDIFESFTDEYAIDLTRHTIDLIANDPNASYFTGISAPNIATFVCDVEMAVRSYLGEGWEPPEELKALYLIDNQHFRECAPKSRRPAID